MYPYSKPFMEAVSRRNLLRLKQGQKTDGIVPVRKSKSQWKPSKDSWQEILALWLDTQHKSLQALIGALSSASAPSSSMAAPKLQVTTIGESGRVKGLPIFRLVLLPSQTCSP